MIGEAISHYRILQKLGAGGRGEVNLADHILLDRKVGIKVMPQQLIADQQASKRLIREAHAAAKLDHPNVCSIYEVGQQDNISFIEMQYVEGETLASRILRKLAETK